MTFKGTSSRSKASCKMQNAEPTKSDLMKALVPSGGAEIISSVQKFDNFIKCNNFLHAFTISPKSTPLMKNKNLKQQRDILITCIKVSICSLDIDYFVFFEIYSDNENIHCHGFLSSKYISHIETFKKNVRKHMWKGEKHDRRGKCPLIQTDQQGIDNESVKRWRNYCIKDIISNYESLPPIHSFKIQDTNTLSILDFLHMT